MALSRTGRAFRALRAEGRFHILLVLRFHDRHRAVTIGTGAYNILDLLFRVQCPGLDTCEIQPIGSVGIQSCHGRKLASGRLSSEPLRAAGHPKGRSAARDRFRSERRDSRRRGSERSHRRRQYAVSYGGVAEPRAFGCRGARRSLPARACRRDERSRRYSCVIPLRSVSWSVSWTGTNAPICTCATNAAHEYPATRANRGLARTFTIMSGTATGSDAHHIASGNSGSFSSTATPARKRQAITSTPVSQGSIHRRSEQFRGETWTRKT